jgi:trans-2,3-dihydro-3-hydroxyanthranilate isomerase
MVPGDTWRIREMRLAYHVLDVFTDRRFGGNPLAVVLEADALDTVRMQTIAREFNLSETVFVCKPQNAAHTARVRIFTPAIEMPFAGHPTVGTAALLAQLKAPEPGGNGDALVVLEEGVGPVRIGVRMRAGVAPFAEFDAPSARGQGDALVVLEEVIGIVRVGVRLRAGVAPYAEFDAPKLPEDVGAAPPADELAAALGLIPAEIGFENHRPLRIAAGNSFAFVPISSLDAMAKAHVAPAHWSAAFHGGLGAFLYCRQTVHTTSAFHARMFAPEHGVPEDPATGSAAVGFAGVIHRFDDIPDGLHKRTVEQGYEMGRPSQIELSLEVERGKLAGVRIGGHAVRVAEGMIEA